MRFFSAGALILSPSKKSIARHTLPSRPALKSLSGSGSFAPWEKVILTFSLCALATAIIPSRDHTGLPIHFHSSMISRSASRMFLRRLANVLSRQSVSFAISWSMRSDGFIGSRCPEFRSRLMRPQQYCSDYVPASIYPRQYLFQGRKVLLPAVSGAVIGLRLVRPEARLLHAQQCPRKRRGEGPGHDTLETIGRPGVRQRFVRLDGQDLAVDDDAHVGLRGLSKIEAVIHEWLEVVLHQPLLDQMRLGERAPDPFRRKRYLALDNDGAGCGRCLVHWSILLSRSSRSSNRLCQNPAIWLVQSISGASAPSCAL